jgi:hypothetical protein
MKLTNAHLVVSSFAALAGVGLAAYQTFAPQGPTPIVVTSEPAVEKTTTEVTKTDIAALQPTALDAGQGLAFSAALNDGSEKRYAFTDLFDGKPETVVTITDPDKELDVLVDFGALGVKTVAGFEYEPPRGSADKPATTLDVIVLPEGRLEPTGRPILSFELQTTPGKQTFMLPEAQAGKALFLRVAGPPGLSRVAVGDFRILTAN